MNQSIRKKFKIAVCCSGGGGNFRAIVDARDDLQIEIVLLIVDRECGATSIAEQCQIKIMCIAAKGDAHNFARDLDAALDDDIDLVVLAGFLPIIPASVCTKWHKKIINTHPSLLPKYGGKGMVGVKVQEAVMAARETYAGCTVHYVSSVVDGGEIILQSKIGIDYQETAWQLGGRVFLEENRLLVEAIRQIKHNSSSEQ
nr:formyltransferase family protein [uncultured Undibacterium sp.]